MAIAEVDVYSAKGTVQGAMIAPAVINAAPPTSGTKYGAGQIYVNPETSKAYVNVSSGVADFIEITTAGSGITSITGDAGSITGTAVTVYADNAGNNCGSTVQFVNSGTVSTLNVSNIDLGNTIIGSSAGNASITGSNNTSVGSFSLSNLSTGLANTALGQSSLIQLTTGSSNVGIGFGSLDQAKTGIFNIGIGVYAGDSLSGSESSNILLNSFGVTNESNALRIGQSTGTGARQLNAAYIQGIYSNNQPVSGNIEYVTIDNTTGLLGVTTTAAGSVTVTGDTGTPISSNSLTIFANTAALNCGSSVFFNNNGVTTSTLNVTDSNQNTLIGQLAGNASISGDGNTGIGSSALANLSTGAANTSLGSSSLVQITTGSSNVGIGFGSLDATNTGNWNIGIGSYAGDNLNGPESSNILLNSYGIINQSNTLCIGQSTGTGSQQLNAAYIQGIYSNTQNPSGTVEYVTIDNTTGQLGVTTSGGSGAIPWADEATSFAAVASNGYFCTAALTATLPASPSQGDLVEFNTTTASSIVVQANTGQTIIVSATSSTTAGTATSSASGNSLTLIYRTADTAWHATSSIGNWVLA